VDGEVDILFFHYMYEPLDSDESICPEKWEPKRHKSEETISEKCLYASRDEYRLWDEHEEKPKNIK
jgi:hypothetical protein